MAYELEPRAAGLADGDRQNWTARLTSETHPGMAMETEFDSLTRAKAVAAVEKLDADLTSDPIKYFGPAPQ